MLKTFSVVFLLLSSFADAAVMMVPGVTGDLNRTLPKGRFFLSYVTQVTSLDSQFDSSGNRTPFSDQFNRSLSWNDIASADVARSEQLKGLFQSKNLDLNSSAGSYSGNLNGRVNVTVPVLGYGINDHVGIYVAVPMVHFQAKSNIQYTSSPQSKAFVSSLADAGQSTVADEFAHALNNGVEARLADAGYDYRPMVDRTHVGDVQIEIPYIYQPSQFAKTTFAFVSSVGLPTGKSADPSDLFGVATGEGRFAIGERFVTSWTSSDRFTLTGSAGVKSFLPASQSLRIPRYENDVLSTDIDQSARLGFAFRYQLLMDAKYQVSRSWAMQAGIQHQHRLAESVSGSAFDSTRYQYVAFGRTQLLESVFLNAEVNSIRAFLDQDFPLPFQALVGLAMPLAGKDSMSSLLGMAQVSLFF